MSKKKVSGWAVVCDNCGKLEPCTFGITVEDVTESDWELDEVPSPFCSPSPTAHLETPDNMHLCDECYGILQKNLYSTNEERSLKACRKMLSTKTEILKLINQPPKEHVC